MNLTRYLAGEVSLDKLDLHPQFWYQENQIDLYLNSPVTELDPKQKIVRLADGREFAYDTLLLTNGARPFVPPITGVQIPGGIIEHQRTSYLDQRALDVADIQQYDGHVTLYMADRYHDDSITFEPAYATRKPDGGWGEFAKDLEVVNIGGEHIQAIDEPYIAKVGAHMSEAINRIVAESESK